MSDVTQRRNSDANNCMMKPLLFSFRRDKEFSIEFDNDLRISFRCIISIVSFVTVCFFPAISVCDCAS